MNNPYSRSVPPTSYDSSYLSISPSATNNFYQKTVSPYPSTLSQPFSTAGHLQRQTSLAYDDKPLGLANLRNTCYINSVLQILFQIIDLQITVNTRAVSLAFKRLRDSHSYRDNLAFKAELDLRLGLTRGYEQQDAHELFHRLIGLLCEENNPYRGYLGTSTFDFSVNPLLSVGGNHLNYMKEKRRHEGSDILYIFGGEKVISLVCQKGHRHYMFESFMDITVSIPVGHRSYRIGDLLLEQLKPTQVEEVDCDRCGSKVSKLKCQQFYNLPPNLVIHVNRFWHGYAMGAKITIPIEFNEILDIPVSLCHSDLKPSLRQYQLIGVVNHFGSINSGHYYSEVRGAYGQKWYLCNDEVVNQVGLYRYGNVSEYAYMLFYRRI